MLFGSATSRGLGVIYQIVRIVFQSDGFAPLEYRVRTEFPRRPYQMGRCPERRLPAPVIWLDAVSTEQTLLLQLGNRFQNVHIRVSGSSISLPSGIIDLASAVRHAPPAFGPQECFSQDGTSGDLVSTVAGCRQTESCNEAERRLPLKSEGPIAISGTQAICQCWGNRFGFRERR